MKRRLSNHQSFNKGKQLKISSDGLTSQEAAELKKLFYRIAKGEVLQKEEYNRKFQLLQIQESYEFNEMYGSSNDNQDDIKTEEQNSFKNDTNDLERFNNDCNSTTDCNQDWASSEEENVSEQPILNPEISQQFTKKVQQSSLSSGASRRSSSNKKVINMETTTWNELETTLKTMVLDSSINHDAVEKFLISATPYSIKPPGMPTRKQNAPPLNLHPEVKILKMSDFTSDQTWQDDLEKESYSHPIVVIEGLAERVGINYELFNGETLLSIFGKNKKIDTRHQQLYPSNENKDFTGTKESWSLESVTRKRNLKEFIAYQKSTMDSFNHLINSKKRSSSSTSNPSETRIEFDDIRAAMKKGIVKDKKKDIDSNLRMDANNVVIEFATNIDIFDDTKWTNQNEELKKLPDFLRMDSSKSILTESNEILGMNRLQMFLKVPGCRTPGHQENNNFTSINLNFGPGDTEWFSISEEYWGVVYNLCKDNGIDYLSGAWWPVLKDLEAAEIPVTRFLQKPGDIVFVNIGTIHWVQSISWCNNIAWNMGKFTAEQYQAALERYYFNREINFKSIVTMAHLTKQLIMSLTEITDFKLFALLKYAFTNFIRDAENVHDTAIKEFGLQQGSTDMTSINEPTFCNKCEVEVFGVYITYEETAETKTKIARTIPLCIRCTKLFINLQNSKKFQVVYAHDFNKLKKINNSFKWIT